MLSQCARAHKDTTVPNDDIEALPLPSNPRTMMLLGRDFERQTYHWEGPFGLPFETAPGQLFGWLRGWTRKVRHGHVLLSPEPRADEPMFYRHPESGHRDTSHRQGGR